MAHSIRDMLRGRVLYQKRATKLLSKKEVTKVLVNNYSPKAHEYCRIIPETKSRGLFDNIHEPEENNCFSIIAQVIIRAIAFSFILLVSSLKTSRNRAAAILKISGSVL